MKSSLRFLVTSRVTQSRAGFASLKWLSLVVIVGLLVGGVLVYHQQSAPLNFSSFPDIANDESFIALSNNVMEMSRAVDRLATPSLSSVSTPEIDISSTQPTYALPSTTLLPIGSTLKGSYTITENLAVGGTITASNLINSVSAGSGIEISDDINEPTITNNDRGSSQSIFKNFAVSGQNTISAASNNDLLTFVAGSNISLTTDSSSKNLTISASAPSVDYTQSGWNTGSGSVFLTMTTDNIGIGTTSASEKLTLAGGNLLIGARTDSAGSWTKISQPTAGTIASGGTPNIETIRSMAVYNGSLYVGTQENGAAEIYRWDGGTN